MNHPKKQLRKLQMQLKNLINIIKIVMIFIMIMKVFKELELIYQEEILGCYTKMILGK
jgi:hypothetical protein